MLAYAIRRILLMIPVLFAIILVNFVIVRAAPGGPVDQLIAQLKGGEGGGLGRISGGGGELSRPSAAGSGENQTRGSRGLDPEFVKQLEKLYGFDKPPAERFFTMLWNYLRFDFGTSFYRDRPVIQLIADKLPVSISLGLWATAITYLISIPLGIRKAVRDGSTFDLWTSAVIIVGYAIPGFLFAILLIVLFAGGSYVQWFPLRGIVSDDWASFSLAHKVADYFWHITLPVVSLLIGSFASLTMLTKNSFLEEINKQYVMTAHSKGLSEHRVLYGHVFRNAMLLVIAGFPGAFVSAFFAGALLIETIFSLDGLGLLSFESVLNRDYPVVFANLYIFALVGLIVNLISDLTYTWIDPRIDFETREV